MELEKARKCYSELIEVSVNVVEVHRCLALDLDQNRGELTEVLIFASLNFYFTNHIDLALFFAQLYVR